MNKKYERYISYIVSDIELPYIKSIEQYGLKQEEYELVLSKVFNQPVSIKDNNVHNSNGNLIYYEGSDGYWAKREYDDNGKLIYYENSDGYWIKREYDANDNRIYYETSDGTWYKKEYDQYGKLIYYENSDGDIVDNR